MKKFLLGTLLSINLLFINQALADTANWMSEYARFIADKPINHIIIPGTHDSATYYLEDTFGKAQSVTDKLNHLKYVFGIGFGVTAVAKKISQAQNRSIFQQLTDGYRFLDLRVIYRDDKKAFYTVHGLFGPSLQDVLTQIVMFTNQHPTEIIIVEVGDLGYMPRGKEDHEKLIQMLRASFYNKLISKENGLKVPLKDLWKQHKQIILIYDKEPELVNKYPDVWDRNTYLDAHWANKAIAKDLKEELDKRLVMRQSIFWHKLFVVQAMLTPNLEVRLQPGSESHLSLDKLAAQIKTALPSWLESWVDKDPNIISVDFGDQKTAETIIKLNERAPIRDYSKAPETANTQDSSIAAQIKKLINGQIK